MNKIVELIEHLMDILNVSFLREPTRRLLNRISNEIINQSTDIISSFMESLSVSDLNLSLDYVVDPDEDTDMILDNIVLSLQRTIPFVIGSVKNIPRINTQSTAKFTLAKIWYKWFVSMESILK